MRKNTKQIASEPEAPQLDPEVVGFRQQFDQRSPLDQIVHEGAQRMLQAAIETEVEDFLHEHQARRDASGNRRVVRNGHLPTREILTGAGKLQLRQPRVRDNTPDEAQRVRFSSAILPPYQINDSVPPMADEIGERCSGLYLPCNNSRSASNQNRTPSPLGFPAASHI